jgi:hypothetical protein
MAKYSDRDREGREETLVSSPGEAPAEEDSSCGQIDVPMDRRGFLAKAGVAGLALVHFTLLGASRAEAEAQCPPQECVRNPANDNCTCGTDGQGLDVCGCPDDTTGKDYCTCQTDQNNNADECVCPPEGNPPDVCDCSTDTVADKCDCKQDTTGKDSCDCGLDKNGADVCGCDNDQNVIDSCNCNREYPATDYCKCDDAGGVADVCAPDPKNDKHYTDPTPDWCTCTTEGQNVDACGCWHDNRVLQEDVCSNDCSQTDTPGVDICACCASIYDSGENRGDVCACGNEGPSYCQGDLGTGADWCFCETESAADWCQCGNDTRPGTDPAVYNADYCKSGCTDNDVDCCNAGQPDPPDYCMTSGQGDV